MRILKVTFALALLFGTEASLIAGGSHHVSGYTRSNGTYVAPHEATNPNNTRNDNYSTKGNTNPYTGTEGTKPRDGDSSGYQAYKPAEPAEPAEIAKPVEEPNP